MAQIDNNVNYFSTSDLCQLDLYTVGLSSLILIVLFLPLGYAHLTF